MNDSSHYQRLDEARKAQDAIRGRGYDVDHSHPDHFDYIMRNGLHCRCQGRKKENENQRGLFKRER